MTVQQFRKADFKTAAVSVNTQHQRCTIPLTWKPFVQMQGMAEAIRTFDGSKGSHSIAFLATDDFVAYAQAMTELGKTCVSEKEFSLASILGHDPEGPYSVEHKNMEKVTDEGIPKVAFYLHPTFTKYFQYDRDTKQKLPLSFSQMKTQGAGFYSVLVKVSHVDATYNKAEKKLVVGMVAYVDTLCFIVPRAAEKKAIEKTRTAMQEEQAELDVSQFENVGKVLDGVPTEEGEKRESEKKKKRKTRVE